MNKRIELMKMIVNADDAGINRLWKCVNGVSNETVTRERLREASGEVFADLLTEHPAKIMIAAEIAETLTALEYKLFEKED